jgi:hypothetical protein
MSVIVEVDNISKLFRLGLGSSSLRQDVSRCHFDVENYREGRSYFGTWNGYVRPLFPFVLQNHN